MKLNKLKLVLIFLVLSGCGSVYHKHGFNHIEITTYNSYKKKTRDSIKYVLDRSDTFNIVNRYIFYNNNYLYQADYVRCNTRVCIWDDRLGNYELSYNFSKKIIILDTLVVSQKNFQDRNTLYINSVKQCRIVDIREY